MVGLSSICRALSLSFSQDLWQTVVQRKPAVMGKKTQVKKLEETCEFMKATLKEPTLKSSFQQEKTGRPETYCFKLVLKVSSGNNRNLLPRQWRHRLPPEPALSLLSASPEFPADLGTASSAQLCPGPAALAPLPPAGGLEHLHGRQHNVFNKIRNTLLYNHFTLGLAIDPQRGLTIEDKHKKNILYMHVFFLCSVLMKII